MRPSMTTLALRAVAFRSSNSALVRNARLLASQQAGDKIKPLFDTEFHNVGSAERDGSFGRVLASPTR
jgi:hypothetical protein